MIVFPHRYLSWPDGNLFIKRRSSLTVEREHTFRPHLERRILGIGDVADTR